MNNTTPLQSVLGDKVTLPYLFKLNGYETVNSPGVSGKLLKEQTTTRRRILWNTTT